MSPRWPVSFISHEKSVGESFCGGVPGQLHSLSGFPHDLHCLCLSTATAITVYTALSISAQTATATPTAVSLSVSAV